MPATAGREEAPLVVLQAHLDMVCERDPDSPHDPREGRIQIVGPHAPGERLSIPGTERFYRLLGTLLGDLPCRR